MIEHRPPLKSDPRTVFMFKRFFDRPPGQRADDPELREAEIFWNRLGEFSPPAEQDRAGPFRSRSAYGLAAVIGALVIGLSIWWNAASPAQPWRTFTTGHARQGVVMLQDGSTVSLAAESRVDVRFSGERRELRLVSGQALFEVSHDPKRPFVVQARDGSVTAVGTAFNIRLDRRDTEVTVVNGTVDIGVYRPNSSAQAASIARATRGEQVQFGLRQRSGAPVVYISRRAGVDLAAITSWTRGKLFFDGEPLEEAISMVNAYAPKKILLKNPKLSSMPVYGVLNQGDVQGLLVLVNNDDAIGTEP